MNHYSQKIKNSSQVLLNPGSSDEELESAVKNLHAILAELTGVTGDEPEGHHLTEDLKVKYGIAISAREAAKCLLEVKRTTYFLRGLDAAIKAALVNRKEGPVRVFYAGCGPYALFLSLLAPFYTPQELQFSLLEINQHSLNAAQRLTSELGVGEYAANFYHADAATFIIPEEDREKYHIFLSETMAHCLSRETMVPIFLNLLSQLPPDILTVPENVTIEALKFKNTELKVGEKIFRQPGATVSTDVIGVALDMKAAIKSYISNQQKSDEFHPVILDLPHFDADDYFILYARVQVWKDIVLNLSDSTITFPSIYRFGHPQSPCKAEFTYYFEKSPNLNYTFKPISSNSV